MNTAPPRDQAIQLTGEAIVLREQGDYPGAIAKFDAALAVARGIGDPALARQVEGMIVGAAAVVYNLMGDYARAVEHLLLHDKCAGTRRPCPQCTGSLGLVKQVAVLGAMKYMEVREYDLPVTTWES